MYPTTFLYSPDVISHLSHSQQAVLAVKKKIQIINFHQTFLSSSVSCGGVAVKGCRIWVRSIDPAQRPVTPALSIYSLD